MTPRVVIVGGGVAGLATALALARGGLPVDVLERDRAAAPLGRRSAASWLRDGAPQIQHAHVFGPGCHDLLRAGLPDVLALLLEVGARELLPTGAGPDGRTGLALRRPLLDWVLRRTAERQPGVRVHSGVAVTGVHADGDGPVEVAVRGGALTADLVVDAGGGHGSPTGPDRGPATTYFSRGYALRWPGDPGPLNLGLAAGGDFDGYTCRAVPGDNHTVTVTIGVPNLDPAAGGLAGLRIPDHFQAAAEAVPGVGAWVEPGAADPLGGISVLTTRSPGPPRRAGLPEPSRTLELPEPSRPVRRSESSRPVGRAERSRIPGLPQPARPAGSASRSGRPWSVAVGDSAALPGRSVEHGVGLALAQALACARAVLAGGDELPPDLPAQVRSATCPEAPCPEAPCSETPCSETPRPGGSLRPSSGPSAYELAHIAEQVGAGARVSA